ncbi:hypothetical protein ACFU6R_03265 [Streptomyces sp. NPDC057499]|uniref:hypothetical protein n=1 Tax=Streptomyces sp. NPDC057499 TaxID=3346150 RepID=UPI0036ABFA7F
MDSDLYVQDDTRTYLGVTSTTLTFWKKTAGAWGKVGNNVGGTKWYLNNASTPSTDTKPGDLLLRTDTGDIWQRGESGWGATVGNLKGPKGDDGPQGPQGIKGDPGGGAVDSVNGKTGAVTLTAADVSAIPTSQKGAASGVASLGADKRLPAAQMPAVAPRNVWTPSALGFQAWSVDPATVANPKDWNKTSGGVIKAAAIQRMYLAGMNITEPTTVSQVVMFARGWGGSTAAPNARFMAGIYDSSGKRLAYTGDTALSSVPSAGQETGTPTDAKNSHIGAVPLKLTASYTLQPGRYWAAFLMPAGGAADFYYMHIENESPSNPSNFHLLGTAFMRAGYIAGQSTLPASFTPSSMKLDHDPCIMALA